MIRSLAADLYQLWECVEGDHGHESVCVYLMLNAGHPILIDCGSHLHRAEIMQGLETLLAGAAPEYIFLTHSELPHAGNLQALTHKWPEIKVIVSNVMLPYIEITPTVPAEQVIAVNPGQLLTVGERRLHFLSAVLKDQPGSHWIFEPETGALFTGDGFGYYHAPGQCDPAAGENDVRVEQFEAFHASAFRFLRWVQPEKVFPDLERVFENYPVRLIAPAHGRSLTDVPEQLARLETALENIYNANRGAGDES